MINTNLACNSHLYTLEYNIMYGESFHGINFTGFAGFYNTNGLSETIKTDGLSSLPFYNRFSIAPNDSDDSRDKLDLYLKAKYKGIELNAKYMNKTSEPFVNAPEVPVLTNGTEQDTNYVMADLKYKLQLGERLTLQPRVYYDQNDWKLDVQFNPEGFTVPVDIDGDGDIERFPKGQLGVSKYSNRNLGAEIQADYDLLDNNVFTLGFKYDWIKQTNINVSSNFDPFTGAETGSIQNINNAEVIPEFTRQIWAVYFQDKWDITDDMGFTFGVRHDHYSDFEGTTNPRLGFVWDFLDNATLKLLYGQAFRAPDFIEMFTNNIFAESDIRVDPETIRTYEIGLGYRFGDNISVNTNYFFNVVRDLISASSASESGGISTFGNIGDANIQGIEFEAKADLSDYWSDLYVFANYTYQDSESKGDPMPDVPKHKGNVGINAGITKYLNANLHAFISGSRIREEADARDDSPGYALLNLTLTVKDFFKEMKIKASLDNLLDKNYNDPTPINTIPTDIPRPGRTFFIELAYEF